MEKISNEKIYNKIKLRLSIIDLVLDLLLITVLAFSGVSILIADAAALTGNIYGDFLLFILFIGLGFSVIGLPFDFYGSYIVEHKFGLSNQTILKWIWERCKSTMLSVVIGVPVSLVFYFLIRSMGDNWWLYFAGFIFAISVFMARIAPVVIFPLFYKFTKLEDGEIKEKLEKILADVNIKITGIFSFNMSKDTKKANAGFTGLGKSKRIILSDTLLEKFTPDEIAIVFAHEAGHYKHRHIVKNIMFSTVVIFASFYICSVLHSITIKSMGFENVYDLAALPALIFYLTLSGLIMMPVTNYISRRYEFQADAYALKITADLESFVSTMEKLAEINLADKEPHPVVEFFLYSHPSIKRRIEAARNLK
ncbi:MAG: peptidase [Spirochaetae bacterium HGW-Spirochaetae-5]|nr:MAG: peptidase [Spirochaetae bacterium HGW-Spirochaetae-5]